MRSVTIVAGPPCSGKSTYVDEHAGPLDVIACHDREAIRAGSRRRHEHLQVHRNAAEVEFRTIVADIAAMPDVTGWVIRCAESGPERQALAEQLRADRVLVLMPPMDVCLYRAEVDGRSRRTHGLIRGWYSRYSPAPADTLVTAQPRSSRAW